MREPLPANSLLRFMTCGSVDDGKSTLIGRLLFDTNTVFDDHLAALARDSHRFGTTGDNPDLALLMDGLQAEREQGITIDVAYRYFSTPRRSFIVADTPGHEQYTRNMATGASTADLAVILVDARKGLLTQTHRHSFIASLMGIRHVVLAINKMDLIEYDRTRFDAISAAYATFSAPLGFASIVSIPVAAITGANIVHRSPSMGWYDGLTMLQHLETADVTREDATNFRMPVQWVCRHNADFRGYAGTVASGTIAPGMEIAVLPRGTRSRVIRIVTQEGDLATVQGGDAVMLTLADNVDIARGDMIVAGEPPHNADQFAANLIWMGDAPLLPGRPYLIQLATASGAATVTEIKHRVDVNTGAHVAAMQLAMNEMGMVNVALDHPLPFDSYQDNRTTGTFILIDRMSNDTVGAGMIRFPLRRGTNLSWQKLSVDKVARANLKRQHPAVLWFTGLSGSGKSTIADGVEKALLARGYHTYVLDGDNIRHGLNKDLGFTDIDRVENIRRVAEVAALFADAGLIVLVSFISPFRNERQFARERVAAEEFFEIFVDAPLEECERRDPKGLYQKARQGTIVNFTGVDSSYESPEHPDIHLQTQTMLPDQAVDMVMRHLREHNIIA